MCGILSGGMSSIGSLWRKEEFGAHPRLEELMGQESERKPGMNGTKSLLTLYSLWGMEEDCIFGRMLGVGRRPFVFSYPSLFSLAANKEPWWQKFGSLLERMGLGLVTFLDPSMIGKWRRFKDSFKLYKIRELFLAKMIRCF